jgi:uncharacterized protein YdaU (DUF1376 family)
MPTPRYMRFFPDVYLNDTMPLTMEEQGVYMRLLCLMWMGGGKLKDDDRLIARMLGIHVNKWFKVKPKLSGYLAEHSPGYITQNRLSKEYRYSAGKSKVSTHDATGDTTPDTGADTPHNTPQVAADKLLKNSGSDVEKPPTNVDELVASLSQKFSGGFDQSKSKINTNNKNRLDLDGAGKSCGKLLTRQDIDGFLNSLFRMFEAFQMQPPPDYEIIRSWLDNGIDPHRYIIPTIREILKRVEAGSIDPPKSWRYFAKEIYQAANKNNQ